MSQPLRSLLPTTALLLLSAAANAQDWSYELEPYMLAASIEGDTSIGRVTGVPVSVDFSAILETLEAALMGHFEAQHSSGWGVILDYGFMDLRDDLSLPRGGIVSAKLRQGIFEALVSRRREIGDGYIDYLAGIRWWDNDIDVTVDPAVLPGSAATSIDGNWVDLIFGARWSNPINDRWTFKLRGDIGGLGVESDLTASVAAGVHFRMTDRMVLDLQYRALWVDFDDGSSGQPGSFAYDTVTHGPLAGVIFKF